MTYRTIHYGIGAIGAGIARLALARPEVKIVAACDADPAKAGRDLGELLGERTTGVHVAHDARDALAVQADVVLHSTGSFLRDVMPQLLGCIDAGRDVISTCEELAYPWHRHPELARELDDHARAAGVRVLGTGINPGFMLDALVLALSSASQGVQHVRGLRLVDVSTRREQLQRKVGVGLTRPEFEQRLATGRFGHVGLKESAWLLAAGLGWTLDSLDETLAPMLPAGGDVATGITQLARGIAGGREVIALEVTMTTDADRPRDEIVLEGTPRVHAVIEPGPQGDLATAAVLLNAIPGLLACAPGLRTMLDLVPLRGRAM